MKKVMFLIIFVFSFVIIFSFNLSASLSYNHYFEEVMFLLFIFSLYNFIYSVDFDFSVGYNDNGYYDYFGYDVGYYGQLEDKESTSDISVWYASETNTTFSFNVDVSHKIDLLEVGLGLFEKTFREQIMKLVDERYWPWKRTSYEYEKYNYLLGAKGSISFPLSSKIRIGLQYKIRWFPNEKYIDYDLENLREGIAELWFININFKKVKLHFGGELPPNYLTIKYFPWNFLGFLASYNGLSWDIGGSETDATQDFSIILRKNNFKLFKEKIEFKYIEISIFVQTNNNYGIRIGGKL